MIRDVLTLLAIAIVLVMTLATWLAWPSARKATLRPVAASTPDEAAIAAYPDWLLARAPASAPAASTPASAPGPVVTPDIDILPVQGVPRAVQVAPQHWRLDDHRIPQGTP